MIHPNGTLFIISAPSGAGKTSLANGVIKQLTNIVNSVSYTTRPSRATEKQGEHYYFVDEMIFQTMIRQNAFLEYAKLFDNFYGTSRNFVEHELNKGDDVILEIDWQGAKQIKEKFTDLITIFILPPSITILQQRLIDRKQDSKEMIAKRIAQAVEEIKQYKHYNYVIINNSFEQALEELIAIIKARRVSFEINKEYLDSCVNSMIYERNQE